MKLNLDVQELHGMIDSVLPVGSPLERVSFGEDEVGFALRLGVLLRVRLSSFRVVEDRLSAELRPWWARRMLIMALALRSKDRIRMGGNRISMSLPEKVTRMVEVHDVRITSQDVTLTASLKLDEIEKVVTQIRR